MWPDVVAVSYTHLDVYKRQPLTRQRGDGVLVRQAGGAHHNILQQSLIRSHVVPSFCVDLVLSALP